MRRAGLTLPLVAVGARGDLFVLELWYAQPGNPDSCHPRVRRLSTGGAIATLFDGRS